MNIITNNNIKCTISLMILENVIDPELGLNVVDLGLILQLNFDETAGEIFVSMTLTTQFCPMGQSIANGVTQALQTAFPDDEVNVQLTFDPPWNYGRISEAGQLFLNQ